MSRASRDRREPVVTYRMTGCATKISSNLNAAAYQALRKHHKTSSLVKGAKYRSDERRTCLRIAEIPNSEF